MNVRLHGPCPKVRRAERRAAPSRPASPWGTGPRTRGTRGSIHLPIFQLVEQVQ